jgi:glycosyltransferase involved in cell wall biosynthesis
MKSLLVITPYGQNGLPTQGSMIAERLQAAGVRVGLLTKAQSGLGRLLDVLLRAFWLVPRYDTVLVDVFGERAFVYESFAILCACFWKRRVVVVLRNGMLPDFIDRWPRWTKFILSRPDLVFAPHGFLQERLALASIQIDGVIPNFVDLEKYAYRRRSALEPKFLYLRGMYPIYNPEMALRAFALIQRRYPEASMTMAGRDGPDAQLCRLLVNDLGLRHVGFVGMVPKDEIAALADQHDIHLHTNRLENMPVTIIEMWACGLPIVGTNVGGMPYLVRNGVDAILVPTEDHQAMATACLEILSDGRLAERLSVEGRSRAEELTWRRAMPIWEHALFGDVRTWSSGSSAGVVPASLESTPASFPGPSRAAH